MWEVIQQSGALSWGFAFSTVLGFFRLRIPYLAKRWDVLMILSCLLMLMLCSAFDQGLFSDFSFLSWKTDWMLLYPDADPFFLLGIYQDKLANVFFYCLLLLHAIQLLCSRTEFLCAASTILSCAGSGLCMVAVTPWTFFLGLCVCSLACIMSVWGLKTDFQIADIFVKKKLVSFFIALFGAIILTVANQSQGLDFSLGWLNQYHTFNQFPYLLGIPLFATGLLHFIMCFPFVNIPSIAEQKNIHLFWIYLLPALSCFPFLLRFINAFDLKTYGQIFGWISLAISYFLFFISFFETQWEQLISLWVQAGYWYVVALIIFSSPFSSVCFLLSLIFTITIFTLLKDCVTTRSAKPPIVFQSIVMFTCFCAAGGFGFLCFSAAQSALQWMLGQSFLSLTAMSGCFFIYSIVTFRLGFLLLHQYTLKEGSQGKMILSVFLLFVCLGVWWTGYPLGSYIPSVQMRLSFNWIGFLAPTHPLIQQNWIHVFLSTQLIVGCAALTAYWCIKSTNHRINNLLYSILKKIYEAVSFQKVIFSSMLLMKYYGKWMILFIDKKCWDVWLPKVLHSVVRKFAHAIYWLDNLISLKGLNFATHGFFRTISFIRRLHIGEIQWYLMACLIILFICVIFVL